MASGISPLVDFASTEPEVNQPEYRMWQSDPPDLIVTVAEAGSRYSGNRYNGDCLDGNVAISERLD